MGRAREQHTGPESVDDRLLQALAHQLKVPLIQIARVAELARMSNNTDHLDSITCTADGALRLLDSYLLGAQLVHGQQTLELEPIAVSSVLYDVAHQLDKTARHYQCQLQLHIGGRYEPVMANRGGLTSALTSLGYVFIEAQSQRSGTERPVLTLAAHRAKQGIVAGVFGDIEGFGSALFRRAGVLYGRARQPMNEFSASAGAGIFVADSILSAMSTQLKPAHHQKLVGLAATLVPSKQLSLV